MKEEIKRGTQVRRKFADGVGHRADEKQGDIKPCPRGRRSVRRSGWTRHRSSGSSWLLANLSGSCFEDSDFDGSCFGDSCLDAACLRDGWSCLRDSCLRDSCFGDSCFGEPRLSAPCFGDPCFRDGCFCEVWTGAAPAATQRIPPQRIAPAKPATKPMELFANPRQVRMQTNASRTGWFPYARERRREPGRAAAAGRYCHPFPSRPRGNVLHRAHRKGAYHQRKRRTAV